MAPSALTPLPYTPQPLQSGRVRGLGHPQLVTFFQAMPRLDHLPHNPDLRVYREHPNVVCEIPPATESGFPEAYLVVKRFGWRGIQHYLSSPLKRSRAMKAYRTACYLPGTRFAYSLCLWVSLKSGVGASCSTISMSQKPSRM